MQRTRPVRSGVPWLSIAGLAALFAPRVADAQARANATVEIAAVPGRLPRVELEDPLGVLGCVAPCRLDVRAGAHRVRLSGEIVWDAGPLEILPGASRLHLRPPSPWRTALGTTLLSIGGTGLVGTLLAESAGTFGFFGTAFPLGAAVVSAAMLVLPGVLFLTLPVAGANVERVAPSSLAPTTDLDAWQQRLTASRQLDIATLDAARWCAWRGVVMVGYAHLYGQFRTGATVSPDGIGAELGARRGLTPATEFESRVVITAYPAGAGAIGTMLDAIVRVRPFASFGWTLGLGPSVGVYVVQSTVQPLVVGGTVDTSIGIGPREIFRVGVRGGLGFVLDPSPSSSPLVDMQYWIGAALP